MPQIYYRKTNLKLCFMALVLTTFMPGCGTTIPITDPSVPNGSLTVNANTTVNSIIPVNGATNVSVNLKPTITFSEAMEPLTITNNTYTLNQGTTPVPGIVSYSGTTAIFTPTNNLTANTLYNLTVTTNVKSLSGKVMASNYVSTFTTGSSSDTSMPTVMSTIPATNSTNVAVNLKPTFIFSEAMDPLSITDTTYTLTQGTTPVSGTVSYSGTTVIFNPTSDLTHNTLYTATITTGAKDLAGNALATNYVWSFTTGSTSDSLAPTIISTLPVNADTNISSSLKPTVTFSEAIDPLTISNTTFTLSNGINPVAGTVTYNGNTAIFTPTFILSANTLYTATITTSAKDLAGNPLASNYTWNFTTQVVYSSGNSNGSNSSGSGGYYPNPFSNPSVTSTLIANGATGIAFSSQPSVTFSEAMNSATITNQTFTLRQGSNNIIGSVNYVGNTATFIPSSNLAPNTLYTATITTGVKDLEGNPLLSNYTWSFRTSADTTSPTTITLNPTLPANNAPNVEISSQATVTFNEAMDPSTITDSTFSITEGGNSVSGNVIYDVITKTATFEPSVNLLPGKTYTATITTGAKDLAGNPLTSNHVWTFTTVQDSISPILEATLPSNNGSSIALNSKYTMIFSEAMDPSTIKNSTFSITEGINTPITGTFSYAGNTVTFKPTNNLSASTLYTAVITVGAKDLAGNPLISNQTSTFTTGLVEDSLNPTVTVNFPISNATNVSVNKNMTATFSKEMDPLTITNSTFTLYQGLTTNLVSGQVSYDSLNKIATFNPSVNLLSGKTYTATITTMAKDLLGNPLSSNHVWSFTTGQAPVFLGSTLNSFAVLAGSTVTTANPTTVSGDLGVSPGTAVVGFSSGVTNGSVYAGVPTAAIAKSELSNAFNDAASRTGAPILKEGNVGGQTLYPGLYKSTSLEISSGDLTLDAQGDTDAVFIFQMATTFNMTVSRQIILAGGAQAKNIFWQVGSSATIGTTAAFKGNILAAISISVNSGANIQGRLLTQSGAVTMDANIVTRPAL